MKIRQCNWTTSRPKLFSCMSCLCEANPRWRSRGREPAEDETYAKFSLWKTENVCTLCQPDTLKTKTPFATARNVLFAISKSEFCQLSLQVIYSRDSWQKIQAFTTDCVFRWMFELFLSVQCWVEAWPLKLQKRKTVTGTLTQHGWPSLCQFNNILFVSDLVQSGEREQCQMSQSTEFSVYTVHTKKKKDAPLTKTACKHNFGLFFSQSHIWRMQNKNLSEWCRQWTVVLDVGPIVIKADQRPTDFLVPQTEKRKVQPSKNLLQNQQNVHKC